MDSLSCWRTRTWKSSGHVVWTFGSGHLHSAGSWLEPVSGENSGTGFSPRDSRSWCGFPDRFERDEVIRWLRRFAILGVPPARHLRSATVIQDSGRWPRDRWGEKGIRFALAAAPIDLRPLCCPGALALARPVIRWGVDQAGQGRDVSQPGLDQLGTANPIRHWARSQAAAMHSDLPSSEVAGGPEEDSADVATWQFPRPALPTGAGSQGTAAPAVPGQVLISGTANRWGDEGACQPRVFLAGRNATAQSAYSGHYSQRNSDSCAC